jgi:hypothetical protein
MELKTYRGIFFHEDDMESKIFPFHKIIMNRVLKSCRKSATKVEAYYSIKKNKRPHG